MGSERDAVLVIVMPFMNVRVTTAVRDFDRLAEMDLVVVVLIDMSAVIVDVDVTE